jgi:hypothetical protein
MSWLRRDKNSLGGEVVRTIYLGEYCGARARECPTDAVGSDNTTF